MSEFTNAIIECLRYKSSCENIISIHHITFYDGKHIPSSHNIHVSINLEYVDSNKPLRITIENKKVFKSSDAHNHLNITIYLDRRYDTTVNGEPIYPHAYRSGDKRTIASFSIEKKVESSVARISLRSLNLLILYLLERRHNIVLSIINELECEKQKLVDEEDRRDFDSVINFLKWVRDAMFPLIDQTVDLSYIKNIEQLGKELRSKDLIMLVSPLKYLSSSLNRR